MWDLVPWPGPLHWEHRVCHWTTREVSLKQQIRFYLMAYALALPSPRKPLFPNIFCSFCNCLCINVTFLWSLHWTPRLELQLHFQQFLVFFHYLLSFLSRYRTWNLLVSFLNYLIIIFSLMKLISISNEESQIYSRHFWRTRKWGLTYFTKYQNLKL